jgi:hypothetical protein
MASSGMLRRVALVRTDVSEKRSASNIRVTRIGELETTLAVTSIRRTLRHDTSCSVWTEFEIRSGQVSTRYDRSTFYI